MRLAFISLGSPLDRSSWSGIPWYSFREVRRRYPDTHLVDTARIDRWMRRTSPLQRIGVLLSRSDLVARGFSLHVNRQLERIQPDIVIAVAAAHKIAYLDPKWPMIYVSDAMFMTVVTYYERYFRLSARAIADGDRLQHTMLERADAVLLASDWAVQSAAAHYHLPPERLKTVPMGANLDVDPEFAPPDRGGPLRLLFIGYDWHRKGGELVLAVWRELRKQTGTAELHIVGCRPEEAEGLEGVTLHGVLRKSDPADYAKLSRLFAISSFFFMPSRQEAFGIVYCEAAAFGRPSIATATGGVPSAVENDVTGILLPLDASVLDYAARISEVWADSDRYARMCEAARLAYRDRLSWQAWGAELSETIRAVAKARKITGRDDRLVPDDALPANP